MSFSVFIIVFIFITGAIFTILERTGTVNAVIMGTSYLFSKREKLKKWFIPASMLLFSLGGSVFGMEEETLIFIPLIIQTLRRAEVLADALTARYF